MLNKFETLLVGEMVVIEYEYSDKKVYDAKVIEPEKSGFDDMKKIVLLKSIEHHENVILNYKHECRPILIR